MIEQQHFITFNLGHRGAPQFAQLCHFAAILINNLELCCEKGAVQSTDTLGTSN